MSDDWQRVTEPRTDDGREWEAFARIDGRLRHVGSVTAPSAPIAREQAVTLVGHATNTVWLCPADAVRRFGTRSFGVDEASGGDEGRGSDGSPASDTAENDAATAAEDTTTAGR